MINFKKGFTFLEIMVVLAILAILVVISFPTLIAMRNNQVLKSATSEIFSALDKARSETLSSVNSSEYGVHFESSQVVIFKGTTYSSSDVNNVYVPISSPALLSSINLTGGAADLYFNRLSGAPNKTGNITITVSSLSKIVTISATGAVSMN